MTQKLSCQKCGMPIDFIERDIELITYHKDCWVEFQQELIAVARGQTWHKLEGSETTEYYEDDQEVKYDPSASGKFREPLGKDLTLE